ncbi:MAG: hypothetical protein IRZ07_16270 [Microbispora sp.]|nr:hypothetical protein [Microbispora sp.]
MNELWRHEARRCGPAALVTPPAVVVSAALLTTPAGGGARTFVAVWLPAALLPLVAGVFAAGVVSREVMRELQCTFATAYPVTVRRRLLLLVAAVGVAAVILAVTIAAHGGPEARTVALSTAVSAAASSLLLMGVGAYAAAGRSEGRGGPASAFAMTAWLAKLLVLDRIPLPPAAVAAVSAAAGLWLVARASTKAGGEAI